MIKQVKFSDSVKFFEQGFKERWELEDYTSVNEPCIFVGVYSQKDIDIIKHNRSKKIVFILGADIPNMVRLKGIENTTFASDKQNILDIYKQNNLPFINKIIPIKNYSNFKPTKKGNKIYCYRNNASEENYKKFKLDLLQPAINYFGKDMFIFGVHGNTIDFVKENFYKKSFLNIQLNEKGGFTSALEMAHMGRKSISNNPAPFCIPFTDSNSIIEIIKKEINNKELDYSIKDYLFNNNSWMKLQ